MEKKDVFVLVVDDDENMHRFISNVLHDLGCKVISVFNGEEALKIISDTDIDLIISDIMMPKLSGDELLRILKERHNITTPVIMMTGFSSVDSAVKCIKLGAFDYLEKDKMEIGTLNNAVERALSSRQLMQKVVSDNYINIPNSIRPHKMIGACEQFQEIFVMIAKLANTDVNVLITGETGTGKELLAQAIHYTGRRRSGPFVIINCASIPEDLLESELFGHEKGAFTNAIRTKPGKFEIANGGTIFLDEIAEASTTIQVKILRAVQEHVIERVGGLRPIPVDVRIIAATNQDLEKAIEMGKFRKELYYRLSVVPIHIPPLRERKDDIPALAEYLLKRECEAQGITKPVKFSPEAMDAIMNYNWPGNIRELENAISRGVVFMEESVIHLEDLNLPKPMLKNKITLSNMTLKETTQKAEQARIIEALTQTGGNRTQAAKLLGISLRSLQYKLKEYNIN